MEPRSSETGLLSAPGARRVRRFPHWAYVRMKGLEMAAYDALYGCEQRATTSFRSKIALTAQSVGRLPAAVLEKAINELDDVVRLRGRIMDYYGWKGDRASRGHAFAISSIVSIVDTLKRSLKLPASQPVSPFAEAALPSGGAAPSMDQGELECLTFLDSTDALLNELYCGFDRVKRDGFQLFTAGGVLAYCYPQIMSHVVAASWDISWFNPSLLDVQHPLARRLKSLSSSLHSASGRQPCHDQNRGILALIAAFEKDLDGFCPPIVRDVASDGPERHGTTFVHEFRRRLRILIMLDLERRAEVDAVCGTAAARCANLYKSSRRPWLLETASEQGGNSIEYIMRAAIRAGSACKVFAKLECRSMLVLAHVSLLVEAMYVTLSLDQLDGPFFTMMAYLHAYHSAGPGRSIEGGDNSLLGSLCQDYGQVLYKDGRPQRRADCVDQLEDWLWAPQAQSRAKRFDMKHKHQLIVNERTRRIRTLSPVNALVVASMSGDGESYLDFDVEAAIADPGRLQATISQVEDGAPESARLQLRLELEPARYPDPTAFLIACLELTHPGMTNRPEEIDVATLTNGFFATKAKIVDAMTKEDISAIENMLISLDASLRSKSLLPAPIGRISALVDAVNRGASASTSD